MTHKIRATKSPLKGLFVGNTWMCNCSPRLPAQHFQTKKEGPNHLRWFYTCQLERDKGCGFFLWAEDAKAREATVVLNNHHSESETPATPASQIRYGLSTPRTERHLKLHRDVSPSPVPAKKRHTGLDREARRRGAEANNAVSSRVENAKAKEFQAHRQTHASPPVTPSGKAIVDLTKSPRAAKASKVADESDSGEEEWIEAASQRSFSKIPQSRFVEFSPNSCNPDQLVREVFDTLSRYSIELPAALAEEIRSILGRHVMQNKGYLKGRDLTRTLLEKSQQKVDVLQAEIQSLKTDQRLLIKSAKNMIIGSGVKVRT